MVSNVDKETYNVIRKNVDFSEEKFMKLSDSERKEWVDACRLAKLLDSECHDVMFEGYKETDMYSDNGTFNLSVATCMVRSKKRALSVIEKYIDVDLTPAQFILMGEAATHRFENDAMKQINLETARVLEDGKKNGNSSSNTDGDVSEIVVARAKCHRAEFESMFRDDKSSGDGEKSSVVSMHY